MKTILIIASLAINMVFFAMLFIFFVLRVSIDSYRSEASIFPSGQSGICQCQVTVWETARHEGFFTEEHKLAELSFDCPEGKTTSKDWGRYTEGDGIRVIASLPEPGSQSNISCRIHIKMDDKTKYDSTFTLRMPFQKDG